LIYIPFMQSFFGTTALGVWDWAFLASLALIVIFAEETRKFFARNFFKALRTKLRWVTPLSERQN